MVTVSIIYYLAGLSLWREPSTNHNMQLINEEPSAGPSTTPVSSYSANNVIGSKELKINFIIIDSSSSKP